jgi:hypothetical protein
MARKPFYERAEVGDFIRFTSFYDPEDCYTYRKPVWGYVNYRIADGAINVTLFHGVDKPLTEQSDETDSGTIYKPDAIPEDVLVAFTAHRLIHG